MSHAAALFVETAADVPDWPVFLAEARQGDPSAWTTDWSAHPAWGLYAPLGHADWVLGHLGQSLNGCIATHSGDACFVTGPENLTHLHRLRALCDGILVGFSTAWGDNPQLTTRRVVGDNPVRVILDPRGALPPDLHVFTDQKAPTWRVCGPDATVAPLDNVAVVRTPVHQNGAFNYPALMAHLRQRGLRRLFIEGGGVTVSQSLAAGVLTRLHVAIAPLVIGGGRLGLQLPPIDQLAHAPRFRCRHAVMGADVLFDCAL